MAPHPSESCGRKLHAHTGLVSSVHSAAEIQRGLLRVCLTALLRAAFWITHPLSTVGSLPSPFNITSPEWSQSPHTHTQP